MAEAKAKATEAKAAETAEAKAETKADATTETVAEVKQETTPAKATQQETEYTAEELASNAEAVFKTRKECVAAALKVANVTKTTVSKAKVIVAEFLKKEVK